MVSRKVRYGQLVRGWDWRTTPERLKQMETCATYMLKIDKTTLIEFAVDYLLRSQVAYPIIHQGVSLVLWQDAEQTSRKLDDNLEDEGYGEWSAPAYSATGIAYKVKWLHKDDGRQPEDYDWSDIYEVERDYDKDLRPNMAV